MLPFIKGPESSVGLPVQSQSATLLRQELSARNAAYATLNQLSHVVSYGESPVVVYEQSDCGLKHGNFIPVSYRAILKNSEWRRRLEKVHSQGKYVLPKKEGVWRELDASTSSDALLMNIFCYPGVTRKRALAALLGIEIGDIPQFGFRPRLDLITGAIERTEVDMKLGNVLFEAKLTESDFQTQAAKVVERYSILDSVFELQELPRQGQSYVSYQLLRKVLVADGLNAHFCVLLDARRSDLVEQWYRIMRCVRAVDLRTRCKLLTWQELAGAVPTALQTFLAEKYGIIAA
ncbi:MAG TPA: hypothetical protein VKZ53_00745 [Candidatus Angelobacter sp.]|nr:hypothetical protein [Candidatus Angelobacter sp.]